MLEAKRKWTPFGLIAKEQVNILKKVDNKNIGQPEM